MPLNSLIPLGAQKILFILDIRYIFHVIVIVFDIFASFLLKNFPLMFIRIDSFFGSTMKECVLMSGPTGI